MAARAPVSSLKVGRTVYALFLTAAVLSLLAVTTHDIWPMTIAVALVSSLLVCWLYAVLAPAPAVQVELGSVLAVGEPSRTHIVAANGAKGRSRSIRVTHSICSGLLEPGHAYVHGLDPGEQVALDLPRMPVQRGHASHSHLLIEALGPFGLVRKRTAVRVDVPFDVLPAQVAAGELAPLAFGAIDGRGAPSSGDQIRGIREWRVGDSPRNVHWRSTARTGALTVVERGEPTRDTLFVIAVGRYAEPGYERAIARGAALARVALERGTTVCLAWKPGPADPLRGYTLEPHSALLAFARIPSSAGLTATDLASLRATVPAGAGVLVATSDALEREALATALADHCVVL